LIVHEDGDWEAAAAKTAAAGFSHGGQSCISVQRVYLHNAVAKDFLAAFLPTVEKLVVGDPLDERTDVSQLISEDERDRVKSWIEEAVAQGATLLAGGDVVDGVLRPTVIGDVRPDMKVVCQEVFGPVVTVSSYGEIDAAFRDANATDYGLNAGIYTRDLGLALRAGRELEFGSVLVNEVPTFRADQMPYGGVKESGNTREGPAYAVQEMTEIRLLSLQG
jgi:acyl-CoA reductase-like NAD-dependent aldehyde dehydrogenase